MRVGCDGHGIQSSRHSLLPMSVRTFPPLPHPFLKCHLAQWHPLYHSKGFEAPTVAHSCQHKPKAQILVQQKKVLCWSSWTWHLPQGCTSVPGADATGSYASSTSNQLMSIQHLPRHCQGSQQLQNHPQWKQLILGQFWGSHFLPW